MWPLIRIAARNVWAQKRRNAVIGLAVMISALLLLLSNAVMNGVQKQVLKGYLNLQSGHVAVVWAGMKAVKSNDPARFLTSMKSFDPTQGQANQAAIERLNQYVAGSPDVAAFYPTVRRYVQTKAGGQIGQSMVYGLSDANRRYLLDTGTIRIAAGVLPRGNATDVAISQESATASGLTVGDQISLETSVRGQWRSVPFRVAGIYANGAGYDNYYAFTGEAAARDLFGYEAGEFDLAQIFLKDQTRAEQFAKDLDTYLQAGSPVLRAESYGDASPFYTNNSRTMKLMFNAFEIFLLVIIAVGLRSTIGINLFQRMREFGTIRAIGFSRWQNYVLIVAEVWFLAMAALLAALLLTGAFVMAFRTRGIYVGSGPVSFALGGEAFYPELSVIDIMEALVMILAFAIFATLGPGLRIVHHRITDLLLRRQRRISLIRAVFRAGGS